MRVEKAHKQIRCGLLQRGKGGMMDGGRELKFLALLPFLFKKGGES